MHVVWSMCCAGCFAHSSGPLRMLYATGKKTAPRSPMCSGLHALVAAAGLTGCNASGQPCAECNKHVSARAGRNKGGEGAPRRGGAPRGGVRGQVWAHHALARRARRHRELKNARPSQRRVHSGNGKSHNREPALASRKALSSAKQGGSLAGSRVAKGHVCYSCMDG